MRILIVESEANIRLCLKSQFEAKGFAVDVVDDAEAGILSAAANNYDLILLDYTLPHKSGFDLCAELRKTENHVRVLMISSVQQLSHKMDAFDLGVDDYVMKPYFFEELYARVRAILRRSHVQHQAVLQFDDLILDTNTQRVTRGDDPVYLTRKEFSLLEYLLRNPSIVISRQLILEHIWDIDIDPFSNTVETHILNLRKKIDRTRTQKLIHSIPGRGYKIDFAR